jgi:restriction system protein
MYYIDCRHDGLGKYRRVTGRDQNEAAQKAVMQEMQWARAWEQEQQRRSALAAKEKRAQHGFQAKVDADRATAESIELMESLDTILRDGILRAPLSWKDLIVVSEFTSPQPTRPTRQGIPKPPSRINFVVKRTIFDRILPSRRAGKEKLESERFAAAELAWQQEVETITAADSQREAYFAAALERWNVEKGEHEEQERLQREEITRLESEYRAGEENAVQFFFSAVLANSSYPDLFPRTFDLAYLSTSGVLLINLDLPLPNALPQDKTFRYVRTRDRVETTRYTEAHLRRVYDSIVYQTALRTVHEIFASDAAQVVKLVTFNGVVDSVDPSTGIQGRKCIVSIQVNRDALLGINLASVDPKACFRKFKGISTSTLADLTPVRPIVTLDKSDDRFVEAYGVASSIDEGTNLAAMDWQDFENLIRELFEKEFISGGGEVKITRASRDGGVDAVAFDPDPIRGGKIVIQAKRYTNVVGISAVRDLFGTVQHEGAMKGILVTTATFGPDAYEFSKDKPLTLISGSELLGLLEKHGHRARINIDEARMLHNSRVV